MPVGLVWPGVGAVFAREMGVPGGECWGSCRSVLAHGVRILLRGTTHPAAPASQPSALGLSARSARGRAACRSTAAKRGVVRLSSARLLGYRRRCVMLAGAARSGMLGMACACAPALQGRPCG